MSLARMKNALLYPISPKSDLRRITLDFIRENADSKKEIVDIGCGEKPLENSIAPMFHRYIGVDIPGGFYQKKPDIYGTAYDTNLESKSADIVLSMQVFEHLQYPSRAISEMKRILRDDGKIIVSFPFSYPLHAIPFDYFRYSKFGFISLLEDQGFKVEEIREVSGIFVVFATYLYNHFLYRNPFLPVGILFAWVFASFHKLEEIFLKISGADLKSYRSQFAGNYVLLASKN